ncbi:hypothetical protein BDW42DRAFT_173823 [Aspergillus taichungensis]|uniref:Uncharacterized protein n=1 Tax=Aspergillus taichungensis TaxID=482145 RepID=A0A2J5HP58_9EURO|nr:hypothetical protein BDW42DRAFT_173823 [Aspergillus taichungensis]
MEPSPQKETPSLQPHAPIMRAAGKDLANKNIPLVEYGSQVQWRCGYPLVLLLIEWAVPDTLLSLASQTLSDHGIPCSPPSTRISERYGQWERAGCIHNLDQVGRSRIYLYPLSFVGLTLQDTVEVTSTFDRTLRVLTPKPRMYMMSLIRLLLNYPIGDSIRLRAHDDLIGFISSYIFRDTPLNTKEDEDDESEEDYQKRVEEAVQYIKTWPWDSTEEKYSTIADCIVRDCRSVRQLSNY